MALPAASAVLLFCALSFCAAGVAADFDVSPLLFRATSLETGRELRTFGFVLVQITRNEKADDSDGLLEAGWRIFKSGDGAPAKRGTDFTEVCGRIFLEPTDDSLPLYVRIVDDAVPELDEDFELRLFDVNEAGEPCDANPTQAQSYDNVTISIVRNDYPNGLLGFADGSFLTVVEGNTEAEATFTVERAKGTFGDIEFQWDVTGPLGDKTDLSAYSGKVQIAEGDTNATFSVGVLPDDVSEEAEKFTITLTTLYDEVPGGDVRADEVLQVDSDRAVATLTVPPNDVPITFASTVTPTSTREDVGTFTIRYEYDMSGIEDPAKSTVTVKAINADGSAGRAKLTADFSLPSTKTITLDPSKKFFDVDVTIRDDVANEGKEVFTIALQGATGEVVVADDSSTIDFTIEPNDGYAGVFGFTRCKGDCLDTYSGNYADPEAKGNAGTAITLRVARTHNSVVSGTKGSNNGNVAVKWKLVSLGPEADGTKVDASDQFAETTGTVDFLDGQGSAAELELVVKGDAVPELAQTFQISLTETDNGGSEFSSYSTFNVTLAPNDNPFGIVQLDQASVDFQVVNVSEGAFNGRIVTASVVRGDLNTRGNISVVIDASYSSDDEDVDDVLLETSQTVTFTPGESNSTVTFVFNSSAQLDVDTAFKLAVQDGRIKVVGPLEGSDDVKAAPPKVGSDSEVSATPTEAVAVGDLAFGTASPSKFDEPADATLKITRTRGRFGNVTGDWKLRYEGADCVPEKKGTADSDDFEEASGALPTLGHGVTAGELTFQVVNDSEPEFQEYFCAELMQDSKSDAAAAVKLSIDVNDNPYGEFNFVGTVGKECKVTLTEDPEVVGSGETVKTLAIKRTGGPGTSQTQVRYKITPDPEEVFKAPANAEGDTRQQDLNATEFKLSMALNQDDEPEIEQVYTVELELVGDAVTKGRLGKYSTCEITVLASDAPNGRFSWSAVSGKRSTVREGDTQSIVVTRAQGRAAAVDVPFNVTLCEFTNGTGCILDAEEQLEVRLNGDLLNGTVPFKKNQGSQAVTVSVKNNAKPSNAFLYAITLSLPESHDGLVEVPPNTNTKYILVPESDHLISFNTESPATALEADQRATLELVRPTSGEDDDKQLLAFQKIGWVASVASDFDADLALPFKHLDGATTATGVATFQAGSTTTEFDVLLQVDEDPQPDRKFIVTLIAPTSTDDYTLKDSSNSLNVNVPANNGTNGDNVILPGGHFGFQMSVDGSAPGKVSIEEGEAYNFTVVRNYSLFGSVEVTTAVRDANGCRDLVKKVEYVLSFEEDDEYKQFEVEIKDDSEPALLVKCSVDIVSAVPADKKLPIVITPGLSSTSDFIIPENDDARGSVSVKVPGISKRKELENADVEQTFVLGREAGTFKVIEAFWMIQSADAPSLPSFQDFSAHYEAPGSNNEANRFGFRSVTATRDLAYYNGRDAYVYVPEFYQPEASNFKTSFSIVVQVQQIPGNGGVLFSKRDNTDDDVTVFEIKSFADGKGGNKLEILARNPKKLGNPPTKLISSYGDVKMSNADEVWHTIAVTALTKGGNTAIVSYLDGEIIGQHRLKHEIATVGNVVEVGRSSSDGYYGGLMRGPYFFKEELSKAQVTEMHLPSSSADVWPSYGWSIFEARDEEETISTNVLSDKVPEIDERFNLTILSVTNGGQVGKSDETGIVIKENDNARGFFSIEFNDGGAEANADEGGIVSLNFNRSAGAFGDVRVSWKLINCQQCDLLSENAVKCSPCPKNDEPDVNQTSGDVDFSEGDRLIKVPLLVIDDKDAEYEERYTFQITQLYADEGDPKPDGSRLQATIVTAQSDYPYGRFMLATDDLKRSRTVKEDVGEITFAVLRVDGTSRNVPVLYQVEGLGPGDSTAFKASNSLDFSPEAGNITVEDGVTRADFSIQITPDNIPEIAERLVVSLLPSSEQTGHADVVSTKSLTRVTIEIEKNDDVHGLVGFLKDDLAVTIFEPNQESVGEGVVKTNHTFTVVRRRGRVGKTTVSWALSETNGQLSPSSGTLTFDDDTDGDGEQLRTFVITAVDDDVPEIAEDFSITLSIDDGPSALDDGVETAALTLAGNDNPHGVFTIEPLPADGTYSEPDNETDAAAKGIKCTITRSGGLLGTVHVVVQTKNSSDSSSFTAAEPGNDFTVVDSTVEFAENETSKTVELFISADVLPEELEVGHLAIVSVSLHPATGAPTTQESPYLDEDNGTKDFYITANDYPNGVVHFPNRFVSDGLAMVEATGIAAATGGCNAKDSGKAGHIVLCRTAGLFDTIVVDWAVEHVTTKPSDIKSGHQKGTVAFGPGEAEKFIQITPVQDKIPEVAETFELRLSTDNDTVALGTAVLDGVVGASDIGGADEVVVTIPLNEDPHGIVRYDVQSLDSNKTTAAESAVMPFTLIRSTSDDDGVLNGGTIGIIKIDYKVVPVDNAGFGDLDTGTSNENGGSVFMLEGQTKAEFRIKLVDDNSPEPQERFKIQIVGAALVGDVATDVQVLDGKNEAVLTVLSSDDFFGVFAFDKSSATAVDEPGGGDDDDVGEASGTKNVVRLTVVRTGGANGAVTVPYKTYAFKENDVVRDVRKQTHGEDATGPVLFTLFKSPELSKKVVGKPFKSFTVTNGLQECLLKCLSTEGCHTSEYFLHPTTRTCRLFKKKAVSRYADADSYAVYEVRSNRDELIERLLATPRDDFLEVSDGEITFLDGKRAVDIIIRIEADEEPELRESFGVLLGTPQPKGADRFPFVDSPRINTAKSKGRIDISENDSPFGVIEFTEGSTQKVAEGKSVTITANRTAGAFGTTTVEWYTNLAADRDLSGDRAGNFTFIDGERSASLTFKVDDDARPELDQPVKFILRGDAAASGSSGAAVVTIDGNDLANGRFGFSSESISRVVSEPSKGATDVRLIILRSHSKLQKTAVEWEVKMKSGANANASDISPLSGTVHFADGKGHGLIDLKLLADTVPERLEEYVVQLTNATGESNLADILTGLDKSTISAFANDDIHGVFSFQDSSELVLEEGNQGTVTVVRSRGTFGKVKVPLYLSNGTNAAIPELDYKMDTCNSDNSSELIFNDGQTSCKIQIDVVQETIPESAEHIKITLLAPEIVGDNQEDKQAPRLLSDDVDKTVTIARNDYASGSFVFASTDTERVDEDSGDHVISVKRLAGAFGTAKVNVLTTSSADGEIKLSKNVLTFEEGERMVNFTLSVIDDTTPEEDESITLELAPVAPVESNPEHEKQFERSFVLKANDDFRGLIHFAKNDVITRTDVEESKEALSFSVYRSRGTFGSVSVKWTITYVDGTAVDAGDDFNTTEGTLDFDASVNMTTLTLDVIDDDGPEIDEDYFLALHTAAGGCNIVSSQATVPFRIVKNDFYSGSFSIAEAPAQVAEDAGSLKMTVARKVAAGYKGTSMVKWMVVNDEATAYARNPKLSAWPHITPAQHIAGSILQWSSPSAVGGPILALHASGPSPLYAPSPKGNRLVQLATLPTNGAISVASWESMVACEVENTVGNDDNKGSGSGSGDDVCYSDYFAVAESNSSSVIYTYNRETGEMTSQDVPLSAASAVASTVTADGDMFVLFASAELSTKSVLCKRTAVSSKFAFSKLNLRGVTSMTTLPLTSKDEESYRWLVAVAAPNSKSHILRLGKANDGLVSTGDAFSDVASFHVVRAGVGEATRLILSKTNTDVFHAYLSDGRIVGADGAPPEQVFGNDGKIAGRVSSFISPGKSSAAYVLLSGAEADDSATNPRMYLVTEDGFKAVEAVVTEAAETAPQKFYAYYPRKNEVLLLSSGEDVRATEYMVTLVNSNTDVAPRYGWLVFKDDEETQDVFLSLINDDVPERDESFAVALKTTEGESNRILNPSDHGVAILANDDFQGVVGFHTESISVAPVPELDTTVSKVVLTLFRARGLDGPVYVPWELSKGEDDAVDIQDADGKHSGIVAFSANNSKATLELFVQTDTHPELAEVFEVVLSAPREGTTAELDENRKTAFVTILGNDDIHGRFRFANRQSTASEGKQAEIQLVRTTGFEGIVDVFYETVPGTADESDDFKPVKDKVRFGHNVKQVVVKIPIIQDEDPEADETFTLKIENATLINATSFLVSNNSVTVERNMSETDIIIHANDDAFGLFGFKEVSRTVVEHIQDEKKVTLKVIRSKGLVGDVNVPWSVKPSASIAGANLEEDIKIDSTSGVLLFKANESSKEITFSVSPDAEPEVLEGLIFTIAKPSLVDPNASTVLIPELPKIEAKKGSVLIKIPENDDARGVFQFDLTDFNGNVEEGDEVTLNITRTAGAFGVATVRFTLVGAEGSGWTADDVSLAKAGLSFANGEGGSKQLALTIRNDKLPEGNEGFTIVMTVGEGGARLNKGLEKASFVIGASDDGNGIFGFSKESRQVLHKEIESGPSTVTLNVERTVATFGTVVVRWRVDSTSLCQTGKKDCDGKLSYQDFVANQALTGLLQFEPGESLKQVKLITASDTKPEGNEHFTVKLGLKTNGVVGDVRGDTSQVTVEFNDDGRGLVGFKSTNLNIVIDEGDELTMPVTRSLAQFGELDATWEIVDAVTGKVADVDFEVATGTLVFAPGDKSQQNIVLKPKRDGKAEAPEHFNLTFTAVNGGGRIRDEAGQAQIQIRGNDNPYGTVKVSPKVELVYDAPPFDQQRRLQIKMTRSGGTVDAVNVKFRVDHVSKFSQVIANNKAALLALDDMPPALFDAKSKALTHMVEIPEDMLLVEGDYITVTVVDVAVRDDIGGELTEPSPTIESGNDVGTLAVMNKDADNLVGFNEQTKDILTEAGWHQITVSRRSVRGAVSCDVVVETPGGLPTKDAAVSVSRIELAAGTSQASIRLTPEKDDGAELDENIVVRLANIQIDGAQGVELEGGLSQLYTIASNEDPHGVISFSATSKDQSNLPVPEASTIVSLQLARHGGAFGRVDVGFRVTGTKGAVEGSDYTVLHSKDEEDDLFLVTFDDDERTASIQLQILEDAEPELTEEIMFELVTVGLDAERLPRVPPTIAGPSELVVKIDESDYPHGQLRLTDSAITVNEDVGEAVLTIERRGGSVGRVTCKMTTDPTDGIIDGDAVDFTKFSEQIVFEDGDSSPKLVKIGIVNDKFPEQDESFIVSLSDPTNKAELAPRAELTTVTITENDDPNGVFEFESTVWSVQEAAGDLVLPINRIAGTFGQVSVDWKATPRAGSGFTTGDLVGHEGTITLAAGQSSELIRLNLATNDGDEIEETFDVTLSNPTNGARVNAEKMTATIAIDKHGTPHGVFSFDCPSIYGGGNADGNSAQEVTLTVERSNTVGEVSVTVFTYGQASTAVANVDYTPIAGKTLVYADGESAKEMVVQTASLQGGNTSKIVSLGLRDATGGSSIDLKRSQSQVTIYATSFTKQLISSLQTSVCNPEEDFESQASTSQRKYTQAEYDQIIFGIIDLLTQSSSELAEVQHGRSRSRRSAVLFDVYSGKAKDLLGDVLDANHIETEGSNRVQNFRGIDRLLSQFGEMQVSSRSNPMTSTNCPSRSPVLRTPNTLLSISTADSEDMQSAKLTPTDGPGVIDSGTDLLKVGVGHTILLPSLAQRSCASMIHSDFRDSIYFPTSDFQPEVELEEGSEMIVMRSKVISASLAGGLGWSGNLKYAVPYGSGVDEKYEGNVECVWWDSNAGSSGTWSADGCRALSVLEGDDSEDMLDVEGTNGVSQSALTCQCNQPNATYFAILVPSVPAVQAEQMASMFSIATFVKAAIIMFVLIQVWQEGKTPHLRLVLYFTIAVFCEAVLSSVSSLVSTNLETGGCTGVGLLLHYFMLAQFTWVIAISIHVYWGGLRRLSTFEASKDYAGMHHRIMVCGWGLPAVIMVIVGLLNLGTDGQRLYGHSSADKRMCLVPSNQGAYIFGTTGSLIVACLLAIAFLASKTRRLSEKAKPWLKYTDFYELDGIKRANGYELRAMATVFAFLVLDVVTGLASSYVTTVGSWAVVHLITSLLLGLVMLYYYGAYSSLRHLFEAEAHALPSKDLRLETFDEPTDEYVDIDGVGGMNETSFMESPARNLVDLSMVSAGFHMSPQALDEPATPGARARGGAGAGARSSTPAWSPMADRETASDVVAAVHRLSETKGQVTDDPIAEEEFDDLVYALRADTFVGGEDSQSLSGISRDLDPQSKNFAMQRISIADTHL